MFWDLRPYLWGPRGRVSEMKGKLHQGPCTACVELWKMGRVLTENGEARECSCVKEAQRWGNPAQAERRAFEVQGWVWTFREQVTDALSGGGGA